MDTLSLITRAQDAIKRIESAHAELLALVETAEAQAQKLEGASATLREALEDGEITLSVSDTLLDAAAPKEANTTAVTPAVEESASSEATSSDKEHEEPVAEVVSEESLVEPRAHEHDLFDSLTEVPVAATSASQPEEAKSGGKGRRGKAAPSKPLTAAPAKTQAPQPAFGEDEDTIDF